ncbi:hypothetical protein EJ03DRAFT_84249 [Teratosphaeria nubilosa]|uniref:Uncharacterized protein n=1 Tax=Teratosphaeria nubilosa TaxID=161662 RepID=A0A6G1LBV1_9PEZI|nr:hypothetical protein EJ03DRAFT_84249 [Teratosphaeria nubilosa]
MRSKNLSSAWQHSSSHLRTHKKSHHQPYLSSTRSHHQPTPTNMKISLFALLLIRVQVGYSDECRSNTIITCDHGIDGNGDCEASVGLHTFCCTEGHNIGGRYKFQKWAMVPAYSEKGKRECGEDLKGKRWCAF